MRCLLRFMQFLSALVVLTSSSSTSAQDALTPSGLTTEADRFTLYDTRFLVGADLHYSGAVSPAFEVALLSSTLSIFGRAALLVDPDSNACVFCFDLMIPLFGDDGDGLSIGADLGAVTTGRPARSVAVKVGPSVGYGLLFGNLYVHATLALTFLGGTLDSGGDGQRGEVALRAYYRLLDWLMPYARFGVAAGTFADESFGGFEVLVGAALALEP